MLASVSASYSFGPYTTYAENVSRFSTVPVDAFDVSTGFLTSVHVQSDVEMVDTQTIIAMVEAAALQAGQEV